MPRNLYSKCVMNKLFNICLAIALTTLVAKSANAIPPQRDFNLREACRQAVAGEYMSAYDAHQTSAGYLKEIESMAMQVSTALQVERKALIALSKKVENVTYDVELSDQVIQQKEKVNALEATHDLYTDQIATAREKLIVMSNKVEYLRKNIQTVFDIVWSGDQKKYPTGVTYKVECTKYRRMCPLPQQYHEPLKKIVLRDDSALACARYISFSKNGSR
jgi:hypothetical protein